MPRRPPRLCSHPGCPQHATNDGRCDKHPREREAWRTTRKSSTERGYGATWQRIRKAKLAADPLCEYCRKARATEVDHIKPKAQGGTDHPDNLRSTCKPCHRDKTALEGADASKRAKTGT